MNKFVLVLLAVLLVSAVGCGKRVEIKPATQGVIMNSSGVVLDVKGPSSFRLPPNWFGMNPTSIVVVEQSDQQKSAEMRLYVPVDRMIMRVDWRGRFTLSADKEKFQFILSRMLSEEESWYVDYIDFDAIWETYGNQIVISTIRAVLSQYSIDHINDNREALNIELMNALNLRLAETPIVCSEFGLSSVQPPDLIVDAQVTRKQREVAIQEALASKIVRITEAEARLAVAQKQQMIDLLEADTQRQVGLKLTQGVNNAFIRQRTLGVLDMLSNSQDRITLIPKEALDSPALMMPVFQNLMSNDSSESSSSEEPSNN